MISQYSIDFFECVCYNSNTHLSKHSYTISHTTAFFKWLEKYGENKTPNGDF